MESDRQEIFQQLCREEKQYSREGSLQDRIDGLPGSRLNLAATLIGLMGEVKSHDIKRKEQVEKTRETMRQQGMKESDTDKAVQMEYQGVISGKKFDKKQYTEKANQHHHRLSKIKVTFLPMSVYY